jgi:uncharacterized protein involved in exopolysaccharide biosynthesis
MDQSLSDQPALFRYAAVLWRRRSLVVAVLVLALGAATAWTLMTTKVYESTATVVAPKESSGSSLLGGFAMVSGLMQQQMPGASLPSLTPNRDLLLSILRSRSMSDVVVEQFALQRRYGERYRQDAIRVLQKRTGITVSREGVISVRVEDGDPQVAANIANFYVERLDHFVAQFGVGEAGRQRTFLTGQIARARTELDAAEESLKRFQENNKAIVLQEQTRGAIEAAARLKGEIVAVQVQLQVMRNFATEANPEIVVLRYRLEELNRQLAKMQYGDGVARPAVSTNERRDFAVPFARVPEVGLELARLTRDVKVQETVVTLLTQQAEQARIGEARDLPTVQVLDRGVPAERPSRPRLSLNLTLAGATGVLIGILLAFCAEYFQLKRTGK